MLKNPEKTIYALYHNHIYDTQLAHYRNIEGFEPHKLALKFLIDISFDSLLKDESVVKLNKEVLKSSMIQWLFFLVVRDKKEMDITRYESSPTMPWEKYFEAYDEAKCEYIRIEVDEQNNISISCSTQIFKENSVLFRQFLLTLFIDKCKEQGITNPLQIITVFCTELCILINNLCEDEDAVNKLIETFDMVRNK